jgi:membrane protein
MRRYCTIIMRYKAVLHIPRESLSAFLQDNGFTLAGALAFYAILSIAPLLVLLVTIFGNVSPATEQRLVAQTESLVGPQASQGVELIVRNARTQRFAASVSAAVSLVILVFSATTVFAQLQFSLNSIFNVRPKRGIVAGWLYKRFLSLLMVLALGLVLIVTVAATSILAVIFRSGGPATRVLDLIVSLLVFTLVFVIVFRVLPDVEISWRDTWVGGTISGLLVIAGEYALGEYFRSSGIVSIYGAAGSLVLLLLWVYYISIIFFFGAEVTQAYANCCGDRIVPNRFAEWDTEMTERLRRQKPQEAEPQEQPPKPPPEQKQKEQEQTPSADAEARP